MRQTPAPARLRRARSIHSLVRVSRRGGLARCPLQALFTALPALLFNLPSRYLSPIGPPSYSDVGVLRPPLQTALPHSPTAHRAPPSRAPTGPGRPSKDVSGGSAPGNCARAVSSRFARRYCGSRLCLPLLRLLICLSSARCPQAPLPPPVSDVLCVVLYRSHAVSPCVASFLEWVA
jgi:hypothetical protein